MDALNILLALNKDHRCGNYIKKYGARRFLSLQSYLQLSYYLLIVKQSFLMDTQKPAHFLFNAEPSAKKKQTMQAGINMCLFKVLDTS